MIECVRSLIITGWDPQALALGFGFVIALGIVSLVLASRALRTRMTRTLAHEDVGRRLGRRVADAEERAHEPADPPADDAVPAVLLHRVRGRALTAERHSRVRLRARLHRVPVRLRAAAVGRLQRRLHRVRARAGLRRRVRQAAAARGAASKRDRPRLRARRDRAAGSSSPWSSPSSRSSWG